LALLWEYLFISDTTYIILSKINNMFLHKVTKELTEALSSFEDKKEWIENPDLSVVKDIPRKYWEIIDDKVGIMSQENREQVDTIIEEERKQQEFNKIDMGILKALIKVLSSEINTLREIAGESPRTPDQLRIAIRNNL